MGLHKPDEIVAMQRRLVVESQRDVALGSMEYDVSTTVILHLGREAQRYEERERQEKIAFHILLTWIKFD